jgi:glycosyltransferase involved in cell wall biosynthesis
VQKRLLYIAPHRPGRSPGQRFRFEQFEPYLKEQGFQITKSYVINAWDDRIFYKRGYYLLKIFIGIKGLFIRMRDVFRANRFDIIFVYREAHFIGSTFFEYLFAKSKARLVYDFDDAIWLNDTSDGNSNLKWLKRPEKTGRIIELSDLVIAGNSYLAEYAQIFNDRTIIIPTTIDTQYHKTRRKEAGKSICIGWTGSSTTLKHFKAAIPFLLKLKAIYKEAISFKVIVDVEYKCAELNLVSTRWSAETEIEELDSIDIGIMPLPDDQWSKGKCGFKGIQYMALEKPAVMSPVGVNVDIIEEGKSGYLANSENEWVSKLSLLIDSEELRKCIGQAGRATIEERFSLNSQKIILAKVLTNLFK